MASSNVCRGLKQIAISGATLLSILFCFGSPVMPCKQTSANWVLYRGTCPARAAG
ncbi:hypothetical protein Vi05172_g3834 [Venturia inaequalis]|nr:hypothetical protein Vi05172_g3834 [Venturia inaequalis]